MAIAYSVGQKVTAALLQQLADYTVNKPMVKLIQQSAQSIPDNAETALTFGTSSTSIDTNTFHSEVTNNTRITPSVAGIYSFRAIFYVGGLATYNTVGVAIRKNGSGNLPSSTRTGPNIVISARSAEVTLMDSANGTTDYYEVFGFQDDSANAAHNTSSTGGSQSCIFECVFERPS